MLDVAFKHPSDSTSVDQLKPSGSIASPSVCEAVFKINLGDKPANPEAKGIFVKEAKLLL